MWGLNPVISGQLILPAEPNPEGDYNMTYLKGRK